MKGCVFEIKVHLFTLEFMNFAPNLFIFLQVYVNRIIVNRIFYPNDTISSGKDIFHKNIQSKTKPKILNLFINFFTSTFFGMNLFAVFILNLSHKFKVIQVYTMFLLNIKLISCPLKGTTAKKRNSRNHQLCFFLQAPS